MPLLILAFIIAAVLSVGYPFIAYYLLHEWNAYRNTVNDDYAQRCLYGAIAMLVLIFLGRFFTRAILSKKRKGEDEPHLFTTKQNEQITRPDGSLINVEYYGSEKAQPIIFVHGLNANCKNWYYQKKYFEKKYRLIMMDLAGMGKSTRPANKDFSIEKMAADLEAVIRHTGVKDPILWGHSMGGMVILKLLCRRITANGLSIKAAILQHTTYTNPVRTIIFRKLMTAIQKPILIPLCWLLIILSPLFWITRWLSYMNGGAHIGTRILTFTGTQTPGQLDFTTLLSTMTPPAVMARGCLGMFKYDVTDEMKNIDIPVLILAADKDILTMPDAAAYMNRSIRYSELVTVTPGNHQALVERHDHVNNAAKQFIEKLK